jgi:hypothetical protein
VLTKRGGRTPDRQKAVAGSQSLPAPGRQSEWISSQLRRVYGEALAEPIPAKLMTLIREIDSRERRDGTDE